MPVTDPVIPVFPAGYGPVAADFTTWVTNPFSFLAATTLFRGEYHASKALTAGNYTLIPLDTILEDPYGGWSAAATGSQPAFSWLTPAGCSGWYEVTMNATSTSPGTTTDQLQAALFLNGANFAELSCTWGVNGHNSGSSGVFQVPLLGGTDYVQMYIWSTAATSTPATAGQYPTMEIAWIST